MAFAFEWRRHSLRTFFFFFFGVCVRMMSLLELHMQLGCREDEVAPYSR
jgi:hypothetical protein